MSPAAVMVAASLAFVALAVCRWPGPRDGRLTLLRLARQGPGEVGQSPRLEPVWLHDVLDTLPLTIEAGLAWTAIRGAAPLSALLAWVLAGPSGTVLTLAALAATPAVTRRITAARLRSRREAQLPVALERLATGVRAGSTLRQAFADTAHATPDPLGRDLRTVAAEVAHGAAFPDALDRWGNQPAAGPTTRLAASALGLAAASGGEVARSVDRVASTLRERRELHAEARALATQARASALVLGLAPAGFTVLVAGVEPAVVTFLFTSTAGFACLAVGTALDAFGAMWMARILRRVS